MKNPRIYKKRKENSIHVEMEIKDFFRLRSVRRILHRVERLALIEMISHIFRGQCFKKLKKKEFKF